MININRKIYKNSEVKKKKTIPILLTLSHLYSYDILDIMKIFSKFLKNVADIYELS